MYLVVFIIRYERLYIMGPKVSCGDTSTMTTIGFFQFFLILTMIPDQLPSLNSSIILMSVVFIFIFAYHHYAHLGRFGKFCYCGPNHGASSSYL
jgi:hypothetical protein